MLIFTIRSIYEDLKWKSAVYYDDFLSLENWENQGWFLDNSMILSQPDFLYEHSLNTSLISLSNIEPGDYVIKMNLKHEIEWNNDYFHIGLNDMSIHTLTGHAYDWNDYFIPFSLDDSGYLSLNFISDASLNYRGIGIDYLGIYKKPVGECDTADLNQDAIIDILEIVQISDLIMDGSYAAFEKCVADLNQDSIINVIDIIAVVNIILEIN